MFFDEEDIYIWILAFIGHNDVLYITNLIRNSEFAANATMS